MGKCHVNSSWFEKTDSLGHKIGTWCRSLNETEVFCTICANSINVKAKGFQSICQHAETQKHKLNARDKLNLNQVRLATSGNSTPCPQPSNISLGFTLKDTTTRMELLWALKSVASNFSAKANDDIEELFRAMFGDALPEGFCLARTKLQYMITEAIGPHFRQEMLTDLGQSYYTVQYDETTNSEGKKELQIAVRYFSDSKSEVVVHHLETFFLGHAKADDLVAKIQEALRNANLWERKLLMLASDGPNVNKKVSRSMNSLLIAEFGNSEPRSPYRGLLDIGTCNVHIVHNAFLKAMNAFGCHVSDLVLNIFYFFHDWPSRQEDFEVIQKSLSMPEHRFLKHVSSRWLTLIPALDRLLEQWPAVKKFFLKYVPESRKDLMTNAKYQLIVAELKSKTILADMKFLRASSCSFTSFTGMLQKEEPLIHIMHDELKSLVLTLLGRVFQPNTYGLTGELTADAIFDKRNVYKKNLLPLHMIVVDEEVSKELDTLPDKETLNFKFNVQQHSIAAVEHLLKTIPMGEDSIIHSFTCLQPAALQAKESIVKIVRIGQKLSVGTSSSALHDEWKLLQLESTTVLKLEAQPRIDTYWQQVFALKNGLGECKYPNISKVVKAVLSLAHGSADVERGFSRSKRVLTDDKASMSARVLNARLNALDGLKRYNNRPSLVPITKELVRSAQMAHKSYTNFLADAKKKAEEDEKRKIEKAEHARLEILAQEELAKETESIHALEKKLKAKTVSVKEASAAADQLLKEANERLKKALATKDVAGAQLAQGMIAGALSVLKTEREQSKAQEVLAKKIKEKQTSLITFFQKKTK